MLDRKTYRETFSQLHASGDTVTEVLNMARKQEFGYTKPRRASKRVVRTAIIAAVCALALTTTALAVGAHTGFFESVFGSTGAESYDAYEHLADHTKPNGQIITEPAYERVDVDEETAETLVGDKITDVNESFTLLGTTVTAESLLMDENGIGVLTFTASNPNGFPQLDSFDDYPGSEVWGIIQMDEADGWVASAPYFTTGGEFDCPMVPHIYLDSTRSTDTLKYLTAYFCLPYIRSENDLVVMSWHWYEYNGEYETAFDGEQLPMVDDHEMHISMRPGSFVPTQTFTADNGVTASVSPLGVVLSDWFDALHCLVLDYADGTSYTVLGEDVRNIQFGMIVEPAVFGISPLQPEDGLGPGYYDRTDPTTADMFQTVYVFNRLVDPENVVAVHTSGGYGTDGEIFPDLTYTK